jgi:hypothetical protein
MTWHPMKFEYDTSSPEHISAIKVSLFNVLIFYTVV